MSYLSARSLRQLAPALAALSGLGLGCSGPRVEKPPAPDMSDLVDAYENPQADFDPSESPELAAAVSVFDSLLDRTSLRTELLDVLNEVLDQATELSDQNDDLAVRIEADGYMNVTRICTGWDTPATPDRLRNGALLVTATFSESGLDPIVWGSAETCRYLSGDSQVELDQRRNASQAVAVYWGESVETQGLDERALLVDMNVDASIEGEQLPLDFDFRSLANGSIEYRIPRVDGALIVEVGSDDRVRLRAGNGVFDCDDNLRCPDRAEPVGE